MHMIDTYDSALFVGSDKEINDESKNHVQIVVDSSFIDEEEMWWLQCNGWVLTSIFKPISIFEEKNNIEYWFTRRKNDGKSNGK